MKNFAFGGTKVFNPILSTIFRNGLTYNEHKPTVKYKLYYDEDDYHEYDEDYGHYSEYEGTWVHDVEGWDDDMINDALDDEPDAYWNID